MRKHQEHTLLTIPEVAARTGVVKSVIAVAVRDGSLHSRRLFGRVVITEEDADRFVIPGSSHPQAGRQSEAPQ